MFFSTINPKTAGGAGGAGGGSIRAHPPLCGFLKNVSSKGRVKPCFFL